MANPTLAASAAALGANFAQFAADLQNQPPIAQQLAAILASLQALQQTVDASVWWQRNYSARLRNYRAVNHSDPLERLYRERPSQGAHQQGSLPPATVFPATRAAAYAITAASLATLSDFYSEQFGQPGANVATRRDAFLDFISA